MALPSVEGPVLPLTACQAQACASQHWYFLLLLVPLDLAYCEVIAHNQLMHAGGAVGASGV